MKTFVCGARIVESVLAASVVAMELKNPSVRRNAGKIGGGFWSDLGSFFFWQGHDMIWGPYGICMLSHRVNMDVQATDSSHSR